MGIYDYVFHFNHYTETWSAIPRDKYKEYWNTPDTNGVLKSKDINVLVELINRGDDFISSIPSKNP